MIPSEKRLHNLLATDLFNRPDNGKSYEYIDRVQSKLGERVRCLDEDGELRIFPIKITNLYITDYKYNLNKSGCRTSVALNKTLDQLFWEDENE